MVPINAGSGFEVVLCFCSMRDEREREEEMVVFWRIYVGQV